MEMWTVSANPTVKPPEITKMPGRPPKARRKEVGETKKSGKLLGTGLQMTCSYVKTPSIPSKGEPSVKRGRGRPQKTSSIAPSPSAPPLPTAPTDFLASSSTPPTYHASSLMATKIGRGRGRGNTSPEKRPGVMGMGLFQAANGFKSGMPSSKIYSTGQARLTRSSDVTGDIGYTPSNTTKLKWNGKAAISTSKLHELRDKQRKKTMGSSSSQNNTSSKSKMP
ncbi:hypothetical protein EJD97_006532 [Solanum chilense]|uniref:Uncharacterized protein n=1 Tax=Solanum chilense TaxID=4083 RepID=A0A6N2AI77_SOLCI|nr:hypothetical protein EJD97_006532 [Solanum chilense]